MYTVHVKLPKLIVCFTGLIGLQRMLYCFLYWVLLFNFPHMARCVLVPYLNEWICRPLHSAFHSLFLYMYIWDSWMCEQGTSQQWQQKFPFFRNKIMIPPLHLFLQSLCFFGAKNYGCRVRLPFHQVCKRWNGFMWIEHLVQLT